jgi:hypothetical protein
MSLFLLFYIEKVFTGSLKLLRKFALQIFATFLRILNGAFAFAWPSRKFARHLVEMFNPVVPDSPDTLPSLLDVLHRIPSKRSLVFGRFFV